MKEILIERLYYLVPILGGLHIVTWYMLKALCLNTRLWKHRLRYTILAPLVPMTIVVAFVLCSIVDDMWRD